jgi:hypothetical protein
MTSLHNKWTREELILALSVYSQLLRKYETQDYFDKHFGCIAGQQLIMPIEHRQNRDYLAYHRNRIFKGFKK